jgi:hypothetical protein
MNSWSDIPLDVNCVRSQVMLRVPSKVGPPHWPARPEESVALPVVKFR